MGGNDSREDGPSVVRSVAVTAEDVVAAVETHHQRDEEVVLRVTPPFSGRMRARLHVVSDDGDDAPVYLHPLDLLADEAPEYPRPADTGDELRAEPDVEYTVERHHDRHADALASWRDRLPDHVVSEASLRTPDGEHRVTVAVLG